MTPTNSARPPHQPPHQYSNTSKLARRIGLTAAGVYLGGQIYRKIESNYERPAFSPISASKDDLSMPFSSRMRQLLMGHESMADAAVTQTQKSD